MRITIRSILLAPFLAMMAALCSFTPTALAADHTKDSVEVVKKAIVDGKAVLVDVREKTEWDDGHLKDAKLLPLSVLKDGAKANEVTKLIPKGKIVYCHCASGKRCLKAADELKKLGYDVRPLKSGFADLLEAGFAPGENPK